ncbi:uncharacterized protein [Drosophila kikkawai]|uniref:Uncharacterized protein n=1 Tax=Drosophila kikkawai TaxID=30033 RepID=A0A6P4JTM4_DROKI|nr:uncharacterized protein LOC108085797 [Drosophila kikkawai]
MSLKFNEAISIVAEKLLEAPKPKFQTYSQDASEISAKMDQELIKINSIFKGTVSNWEDTIKFYKAELPKLNFPFLRLKVPFTVEPQRVLVFSSDRVQPVNLKTSVNHPAVENGYLNGEKLTQLFIWDLNRVIDRISKITCSSGKIYKLVVANMITPGGVLINILAKENASELYPSICYEFLISYIFPNQSFCYTFPSNFFNQISAAGEVDLKKIAKVVNIVKVLLHTFVNQYSKISTFGLQMVYDSMNAKLGIEIVSELFEAIPRCIPHLQNPGPFISAYGKLLQMKQSDSVQLSELKEVFGLK